LIGKKKMEARMMTRFLGMKKSPQVWKRMGLLGMKRVPQVMKRMGLLGIKFLSRGAKVCNVVST